MNISGSSSLTADTPALAAGGAPVSVASQAATPSPASADLSLVIEDDKAAGELVYKTVNRVTGAVVNQYPNAQMVKLREDSGYARTFAICRQADSALSQPFGASV